MSFRLKTIAAVVILTQGVFACEGPGAGMVAYVGGVLWDGTGGPPVLDAVILVEGTRIVAAGPPDLVDVPRGAVERRTDGRWIVPGLIDANVNIDRWMLRQLVERGVTTIRGSGGTRDSVLALRDEVNLGGVLGPRMFVSGAPIDRGPSDIVNAEPVRTGEEARRAIDSRVLDKVSFAWIGPRITASMFSDLMHEAKVLRFPVAAQVGRVDALTAAREGIRSLEGLGGIPEATVTNGAALMAMHDNVYRGWAQSFRTWAVLDSARLERTAQALAQTQVFLVPSLVYYESVGRLRDRTYRAELELSTVPQQVQTQWQIPRFIQQSGFSNNDFTTLGRARVRQDLFLRRFLAHGGHIVTGSGTPGMLRPPGLSLVQELELLVAAGLTTKEALLAATRNAALLLEADSLGVLREGSVADFVVLRADPLANISSLKEVDYVVFRGTRQDGGI